MLFGIDVIDAAAITATVPLSMAERWAAPSMPRARPDTTTKPASAEAATDAFGHLVPPREALREPTMATVVVPTGRAIRRDGDDGGRRGDLSEIGG